MTLTPNPNRFLHGLSDISKIRDVGIAQEAPTLVIPIQPVSGSAPVWIEYTTTLTVDGAQALTLPNNVGSYTALYINGLKQLPNTYAASGLVLSLPITLELFTNDVVDFVYTKA